MIEPALLKQKFKADRVMTPEEYAAMPIIGWHQVCKDFDGCGNVGVRFSSPPNTSGIQGGKCAGCDGHECDKGCQYPGAAVSFPSGIREGKS